MNTSNLCAPSPRLIVSTLAAAAVLALGLVLLAQHALAQTPGSSLVAHWQFNEPGGTTAYDSAGTHDGELQGSAYMIDGKLHLGIGDSVSVASVLGFPSGGQSRTVAACLSYQLTNTMASVLDMDLQGMGPQAFVVSLPSVETPSSQLFTDLVNAENTILYDEEPTTATMHHLSFVLGDADDWYYYLDGALLQSGHFPIAVDTVFDSVTIGNGMTGVIDDLRVYSDDLVAADVEALSDQCLGSGPPDAVCGNGTIDAGDECDDGNTVDGDGCSAQCRVEGGGGGGWWLANQTTPIAAMRSTEIASLSGLAFVDLDADGVRDPGERTGFAGAVLVATRSEGGQMSDATAPR